MNELLTSKEQTLQDRLRALAETKVFNNKTFSYARQAMRLAATRLDMHAMEIDRIVKVVGVSREALGLKPASVDETTPRLQQIMEHDYPILAAFHSKHGVPPLQRPSCLVCGHLPKDWPPAIQHMELPSVIVCDSCHEAVRSSVKTTQNETESHK